MRKALLFALMLMLLLTACGGEKTDPVAGLQQQYAAVESATMEADITCHYDDEVREYTLLCAYTPERSTVTVLAPENLAGISAAIEGGMLTLSYDDLSLDAGSYSAAAVSPVVALPKLVEAAAWGYPAEQSAEMIGERTCIRLGCDLNDGVLVFEIAWARFEVTERAEIGDRANDARSPVETGTTVS